MNKEKTVADATVFSNIAISWLFDRIGQHRNQCVGGRVGQLHETVNLAASAYAGSNPARRTKEKPPF